MNGKKYKPYLITNDTPNLDILDYSLYYKSKKRDGIRVNFNKGEMLSRSLKQIQNKQLQEQFQNLKDFSKKYNAIIDAELYSHSSTFQHITSLVMTQNYNDKNSIKKHGKVLEIPIDFKAYIFDIIFDDNYEEKFENRYLNMLNLSEIENQNNFKVVKQLGCLDKKDVITFYEDNLKNDYEGVVLKRKDMPYKCGRSTLKTGDALKLKPYKRFDAIIKGVTERMENTSESFKNELGNSTKSRKNEDMIPTGIAAAFIVDYEGKEMKVSLTGDMAYRKNIFENKEDMIGKWIEFEGMEVGSKNVPRHPSFIRFRDAK